MNVTDKTQEAVIGTILLEESCLNIVLSILKPEHFYTETYKNIYQSILNLYNQKSKVDLVTVTMELHKMGVLESIGGAYFVSSLTNSIASAANIESHCRILIQLYLVRRLSELGKRIDFKANEHGVDCFELLEWVQKETKLITDGLTDSGVDTIENVKNDVLKDIRRVIDTGQPSGIKSSLIALNNQTNGWQKSDLIIVAGRPGMGKTSVALDFALHPALNGIATAFFSLEMSKNQLVSRVLSLISQMPVQKIVTKQMNSYDLELLEKDGLILNGVPFFIDDTPALKIFDLTNKARKLKRDYNIELLVVDYIQLMRGTGQSREQEISDISRGLKSLAKELNIPIIALSQLSRAVESRPDKKPMLSDLRESGAIEQDADMVIFPFRPEYYEMNNYFIGGQEISAQGLMMLIIAKFRNGSPGEVRARWIAELTKIDNY